MNPFLPLAAAPAPEHLNQSKLSVGKKGPSGTGVFGLRVNAPAADSIVLPFFLAGPLGPAFRALAFKAIQDVISPFNTDGLAVH
jgi:hypothetical protein